MLLLHSLSGRDTSSFPYFTGKKAWRKSSMEIDTRTLEEFGENPSDVISEDVLTQERDLTIAVYTSTTDQFEESALSKLRAYK